MLLAAGATAAFGQSGPAISSVAANATQVGAYGKFELTFDVATNASNVNLPYDAAPPQGVQAGLGVSVDALFSPDNWQSVYTIPAFPFEDFRLETRGNMDWLYPVSGTRWKARFAPNTTGQWQYRLRAQDSSGTFTTQPASFNVVSSSSKGFIRVSPDPRYFSFEKDGSYFPGLGYNLNYSRISWDNPVSWNRENFQTMGADGIQLIRMWLSQWSIYSSAQSPWNPQEPHLDPFWEMQEFHDAYPGSESSILLDATDVTYGAECMFWGWERVPPSLERNKNYRIRVRFRTQNITGPRIAGSPTGFVVKTGGWLWDNGNNCNDPGTGTVRAATYSGSGWSLSTDPGDSAWSILETTINSGDQDYLDYLYLVLENANGGQVYVDHVWLQEALGGGQFGPNLYSKPWMSQHLYFDQRQSFAFDKVVELAEQNGVYLRPVLLEKSEDAFGRMNPNGTFGEWDGSNNNFYGEGRQMTKGRWLQRAWWRYAQARWGYSTAIHSWELLNEGDPFNQRHYDLADEFAKYMHQFGPNSHLANTSFWHSFPRDEFWANGNYSNIDFADIHQYIPQEDPNYGDLVANSLLLGSQVGARTGGGAGKPTVRGETGIVDFGTDPPSEIVERDTQGVFLHNLAWTQLGPSGLMEPGYWYYSEHIANDSFDRRGIFRPYYDFVKDLPLTNGRYVDAQAASSDSNLRVIGQKDTSGGRAHLWIQNRQHTWRNAVNGVQMTPRNATITVGGFSSGQSFAAQWYNTVTGQTTSTQTVQANGQGAVTLSVSGLTEDVAVKLALASDPPPPPPTGSAQAPIRSRAAAGSAAITSGVTEEDEEAWPMAAANPERTSWVPGEGITEGDVEWYKPFEAHISSRTQIIAAADTLFVSTASGLYALDADTGNEKWVYPTEMPLGNSPTIAGGVAYVGGMDKKLHAVSIDSGARRWTFDAEGGFLTNPLVIGGVVYAGSRDGYMYAVDAQTGELRWKFKTGAEILFSAAYKDGAVYFASNDMRVYALNADTGAQLWRSAELPSAGFYSFWPVVREDEVIVVGTPTYQIHPFTHAWLNPLIKLQLEAYGDAAKLPRGTTVGPRVLVNGEWARGTAVIDASKPNAVGAAKTLGVTEYLEQRPYRRTYFVLDRQTGVERTYDFDGDGRAEYAPILHSSTHSGTRYPPLVGRDGLLYQKTSYLSDEYIPGGHIAGWKPDSPYLTLPAKGEGESYYWLAEDEPAAYSGQGDVLYYNLCCDRIGGWLDLSKPGDSSNAGDFFTYSTGHERSLREKTPNYRKYWHNPDDHNQNAVCGGPEGCYGTFGENSPYGWHGNQNPPIPYKGRIYMHRSNAVIAISPRGGRAQKAPAAVVATTQDVHTPSRDELRARLDAEVIKMVDAGHLRPGSINLGLASGTGACGTQMADYFHDPAETIHALMQALPQVSPEVAAKLEAYIRKEMADYPPYLYEHIGFNAGARRERYPTPPDLAETLANIAPLDQDWTIFEGYERNPFLFYALWEYAKKFGNAKTLFDASKDYLNTPPGNDYLMRNPNVFNQYVAGYYGYLQLQALAGYAQSKTVETQYHRLLTLRGATFSKDSAYAGDGADGSDPYCRGFNASSNFLYLTPEVAAELRDKRLGQVSEAVKEYQRLAPFWFVSNADEGFGENALAWLHDTHGIFMAKALILQQSYGELARYVDTPGFERGDLFYIQNLAAALAAPE
ncbi:MAG: PQQ-binding-like beta-propeller repeat protein [Acidobacteria bacterium]|nr:PQQ-binding-like beta-propeller repeat protein [Acidobacteriota bacterium]